MFETTWGGRKGAHSTLFGNSFFLHICATKVTLHHIRYVFLRRIKPQDCVHSLPSINHLADNLFILLCEHTQRFAT